ncbi:MAG: hypothetical protein ACQ9MH_25875 [Nitrospinales bacterium]
MKTGAEIYHCDIAAAPNVLRECPNQMLCSECPCLTQNGGYCHGCDGYQVRCLKRLCVFTSCGTCSGGRHATVAGCCGRAPESWRKQLYRLLDYPVRDYFPPPLKINCRLIPVIYAQIKKYKIPDQFPKIDAWAAPIHKIANKKGEFRSHDLKDYLGIPSDRKLILSTCAPDDYQEMLWGKSAQMNYKSYGIDYWFPAHFSIYDNDSKLYQFISAKRQQLHAIWTESQFVWFRLGDNIPIQFLLPIRNAPSVLISTSQMYSKRSRTILQNEVKVADSWFPYQTAFFITGGYKNLPVSNRRTCFEFNSSWLMRGLKGYDMERKKVKKEEMDTKELLTHNLRKIYEKVHLANA